MSRYMRPQVGSDMYKVAAGFALALAFLCVASINIADSHLLHQQQSNSDAVHTADTSTDQILDEHSCISDEATEQSEA